MLDEAAAHGRTLSRADDNSGARPAVLADTAWRIFLDADPRILGRTIYLNRVPFVVVGVMPPGFQLPTNVGRVHLYGELVAALDALARSGGRT